MCRYQHSQIGQLRTHRTPRSTRSRMASHGREGSPLPPFSASIAHHPSSDPPSLSSSSSSSSSSHSERASGPGDDGGDEWRRQRRKKPRYCRREQVSPRSTTAPDVVCIGCGGVGGELMGHTRDIGGGPNPNPNKHIPPLTHYIRTWQRHVLHGAHEGRLPPAQRPDAPERL